MNDPLEATQLHLARVEQARAVLLETYEDLVDCFLAIRFDEPSQHIADRMYQRLEAMTPRDLALAVAVSLDKAAQQRAHHLLSKLGNARWPEEMQ